MTVQYILKEEITCCFFFKLDKTEIPKQKVNYHEIVFY